MMTPGLQFAASVVLAAVVISYGISDVAGTAFLPTLVIVGLILGIFGAMFWRFIRRRQPSEDIRRMKDAVDGVHRLSLSEARRRALEVLADRERFRTSEPFEGDLPKELPDTVAELFRKHATIETVAGEARLAAAHVGAAKYRRDCLRIGSAEDATELVVLPGQDSVFEIDGSEADEQELASGGRPSVYHWVLEMDEVFYGE